MADNHRDDLDRLAALREWSRERVQQHRAALSALGVDPETITVEDVRQRLGDVLEYLRLEDRADLAERFDRVTRQFSAALEQFESARDRNDPALADFNEALQTAGEDLERVHAEVEAAMNGGKGA